MVNKNIKRASIVLYFIIVSLLLSINAALAYSYSGKHWHAAKTSLKYGSSLPAAMTASTYYGYQKTWNEGSPSSFYFYYYESSNNKVEYGYIDGTGGYPNTIAKVHKYTYSSSNSNHIISLEMLYDKDEPWHTDPSTNPPSTKFDVWSVAAHEFGHWLKLGHSGYTDATMYGQIPKGETKKRTLHSDDKNGIWYIYETSH